MAEPRLRSDLAIRTASGLVLVLIAGLALWAEGGILLLLILLVAALAFWEWRGLVLRFPDGASIKALWLVIGLIYVAGAAFALLSLGFAARILVIGIVIATDVGAYFAGRTIGGPKIAPLISPSKTWAGLGGGMLASALLVAAAISIMPSTEGIGFAKAPSFIILAALTAAGLAIVAQVGDFFESWMKRRAAVKDSGALIPGHGGVLDRVDGLLLVALVCGILTWVGQ